MQERGEEGVRRVGGAGRDGQTARRHDPEPASQSQPSQPGSLREMRCDAVQCHAFMRVSSSPPDLLDVDGESCVHLLGPRLPRSDLLQVEVDGALSDGAECP